MKIQKLEDMVKGWFVGNFDPTVYRTNDIEVGIKLLKTGDVNEEHFHKLATEITCIIEGECIVNDKKLTSGDIMIIKPYELSDFKALTDIKLVVIKIPGANDDKYSGPIDG